MRMSRPALIAFITVDAVVCLLVLLYVLNMGDPQSNSDTPGNTPPKATLTVAAPPGGLVGLPVLRMIEQDALADAGYSIVYRDWKNPEQLRAMIASGEVDFIGMPSNLAANFYNRGVPVRMVDISIWSVLWVVSSNPTIDSLDDLAGQELVVPFKGNLPDIILQAILSKMQLDDDNTIRLRYAATPLEAAQLLLAGKAKHALLSEPEGSLAILRSLEMEDGPALDRRIDLQTTWGKAMQTEPRIALAGMAALGQASRDDALIAAFHAAYVDAIDYCKDHPEAAGRLADAQWVDYDAAPLTTSISTVEYHGQPAAAVRDEIEFFLAVLADDNPARIGGKLPDDAFYWGPVAE